MNNRVAVEIYGYQYPINTQEDPAYVRQLAEEVDNALRTILEGSRGTSVNQGLVLLSLNYLDNTKKCEESADRLREQLSEYLEESATANMELSQAQAEIERLNRELEKAKK